MNAQTKVKRVGDAVPARAAAANAMEPVPVSSKADIAIAGADASLMAVIAKAASDPGVDIDKMERLLQMQERVEQRDAERVFNSAFAKMQPELPVITMNGEIVHKGRVISKFSDWPNINKAVLPILSRFGFALSFKPHGQTGITAILRHEDGHNETATVELPADTSGAKNQVQSIGSSLTYGKRYAGVLILNLTIEGEDDDGSASGPMISHEGPRDMPFPQGPAKNKSALKEQAREVWRQIEAVKSLDELETLTEEHGPLLEQLKEALPSWWTGGQRDGNSFEGLGAIIGRIQADFANINEYNERG